MSVSPRLGRLAVLSLTVALASARGWSQSSASSSSSAASQPTETPTTKPIVSTGPSGDEATARGTETIVFLRHGEKPAGGLGQLTPQGLNRALALPAVLARKFGKPNFIYAPDPSATKVSEGHESYFYVRPLVTIEPTAIALGMPIMTPFGFAQIKELNEELTKPKHAAETIFVSWEHGYEQKAVVALVKQFGGNDAVVPKWAGSDYDSLYVVKITRTPGRPAAVAFVHEQEGLDNQSKAMPAAAGR